MKTNDNKPLTVWSLVRIPAIISLVVTVLRLVGELLGWMPYLFGPGGLGPDGEPIATGKVGITALIPLFGIYFGYRLQQTEGGPSIGRAVIILFGAIAVVVGGLWAAVLLGLASLPDPRAGTPADGFIVSMIVLAGGIMVARLAWQRLAMVLLLYAVLARLPVILVTWLSVTQEWATHYGRQMPNMPPLGGMERVMQLVQPQVGFWIVVTVVFGGLFGMMGARFAGDSEDGDRQGSHGGRETADKTAAETVD